MAGENVKGEDGVERSVYPSESSAVAVFLVWGT